MLDRSNGKLYGLKWIGDDGAVLLAVGDIDYTNRRNASYTVLQSLTLNHNQRLVGVKSYSGGWKGA